MVHFPLTGLDLTRHHLAAAAQGESAGVEGKPSIYDCISVVNHYGGLWGGHYTAYANHVVAQHGAATTAHGGGQWLGFDDSRVSRASPEDVVSPAAYIMVYRRRD